MENPRADELRLLCTAFELDTPYCPVPDMLAGIREIEQLPTGSNLSALQRLALLENLRRVLMRTALARQPRAPMAAQARRHRWQFLRAADPQAAAAYVAVLVWFEIEVPECLLASPP